MQQLKYGGRFSHELELKQLTSSGRVSLFYIHGTARSGSTITEIILAQLADLAIHQPFRGTLQKSGGRFRQEKLDFDADIYDAACGLIVQQIKQYLTNNQTATVVIKELAGFFHPCIWRRWLEIPDRFLFTIREPHLQYMSWLSAMTDKVFQGKGKLQENRDFVIDKAQITENSILPAEWEGTTISCNQAAWQALLNDFQQVKQAISGTEKKIAILDSVLLRYNPEVAIKKAIAKLNLNSKKDSQLNLNNLTKTAAKVWDIRDKTRPMVRKANKSKTIAPLTTKETVSLDIFPVRSQQHIRELIPLYLKLLYAPEQAYLPTLSEIATTRNSELITTHPTIAYAIAFLYLQDKERVNDWLSSLAGDKSINIDSFQSSLTIVNQYWKKTQKIYG